MFTRRLHWARAVGLAIALQALVVSTTTASASAPGQPAAPAPPSVQGVTPAAAEANPEPAKQLAVNGALSNERTVTTWAHPLEEVGIRARPLASARAITRTHLATEDGVPEVYLLLASLTDARGRSWVRMRIPGRPNGRIGWVPREALGEFHVTRWLLQIKLTTRRLIAYYGGRPRFTAPVGIGKPSTPTPPGRFWIREIFKLTNRSNPYWPYAIGTSAYSTLTDWPGGGVVGIHGDFGEPRLIPGDPSHGCVRMRAGDLSWLAARVQIGTPVHITN
jgi:L,D-transpeptidase catalytic domain